MPIIPAKFGQIVGVALSPVKQFGEAGQAGIDRVADSVDDGCVRQRQMDEAGKNKIGRRFVSDMRGCQERAARFRQGSARRSRDNPHRS